MLVANDLESTDVATETCRIEMLLKSHIASVSCSMWQEYGIPLAIRFALASKVMVRQ